MLKNKTAVVTGGARGIGKAIAETFCRNGANVIICDICDEAAAEKTVSELKSFGTQVRFVQCNVTDPGDAKKVADIIKNDFDKTVDILVNNAGITNDKLMIRMSDEDFTKVINVNLNGVFFMMKEIASLMIKKKSGAIINMASVSGLKGNPAQVNYSASKAGVVGMTKSAAKELGRRGIRVNAIAPGFVATDMTAVLTDEQKEHAASSITLGRLGQPQDIANTALFLASDLSSYITGQVISVDGGIIM